MTEYKKYRMPRSLIDAEQRSEDHSQTFTIPDEKERYSVCIGDNAKIGVELDGRGGERFWVMVERVVILHARFLGKPVERVLRYEGVVDNAVFCAAYDAGLRCGSKISFEPKHVLDILTPEECGEAHAALAASK
jgi:hypothetical protein